MQTSDRQHRNRTTHTTKPYTHTSKSHNETQQAARQQKNTMRHVWKQQLLDCGINQMFGGCKFVSAKLCVQFCRLQIVRKLRCVMHMTLATRHHLYIHVQLASWAQGNPFEHVLHSNICRTTGGRRRRPPSASDSATSQQWVSREATIKRPRIWACYKYCSVVRPSSRVDDFLNHKTNSMGFVIPQIPANLVYTKLPTRSEHKTC